MKEYPIIMSGNHPKLILDSTKTMTRRVLRKQPLDILPMNAPSEWIGLMSRDPSKAIVFKCRYGQVGDRLWVRETYTSHIDTENNLCLVYYGDDIDSVRAYPINFTTDLFVKQPKDGKHPSIHMPRWASRITLEITEVRVERVQEITNSDAILEGMTRQVASNLGLSVSESEEIFNLTNAHRTFQLFWDSLNAKRKPTKFDREYGGITEPITPSYEWMSNPWVWVISFKRA